MWTLLPQMTLRTVMQNHVVCISHQENDLSDLRGACDTTIANVNEAAYSYISLCLFPFLCLCVALYYFQYVYLTVRQISL